MVTSIGCRAPPEFERIRLLKGGVVIGAVRNSIHYCIELHSDLKWEDVKSSNETDPGRYPRKAVRGGGARLRGTGNWRRQHRGHCGCGRLNARGVLFEFQEQGRVDHRHARKSRGAIHSTQS